MTIDTKTLRVAAQAVIDDFGADWYDADDWTNLGNDRPPDCDARHIAAASPTAVIGLIDHIDALVAEIERLRGVCQEAINLLGMDRPIDPTDVLRAALQETPHDR